MRIVENHYFKHYVDEPKLTFISGCSLPNAENGIVKNVVFRNCTFHPGCKGWRFVNCEFVNCCGDNYIRCC